MPAKKRPQAAPNNVGFGSPGPSGTAGKQKAWNVAHKADAVLHPEGTATAAGYAGFGDKPFVNSNVDSGEGVLPKKNLRSLKKAVKSVVPENRADDMRRVPKVNPGE